MYRFQGTNNRSNGIYCEPEAHFSPPHGNKKSSSKMRHHHRVRSNNRSAHLPHRNDSDPDSSSDVSDGTYQESSDVHGHGHQHSGMTMTNRDRLNMVAQNGGADSPPEPAPSDMRMNGGLRSLKPYGGELDPDSELSGYHHVQTGAGLYLPQEYLMSSPYQPKSPMPIGTSLATAKKLFQGGGGGDNLHNETADSNSTLSTLPSQARLIGGLGGPPTSNPVLTGIPQAPVILPVFPTSQPHGGQAILAGNGTTTNSRSLQRNQYSPSRFTIQKDCHVSDRCSWKCISIALIILCVALISILIYTAAIMGNCSRYSGSGCILVEDAKVLARGEKSYPVIDLTSMSPKSSEDMASPTTVLPPELTSRDFGSLNDGLSPLELLWGQPLFRRVEPYSFWTLEVNMRDSAYVNLNLSFSWGSNWALIFRKNALPSITQHDLIKIVKNGRMEHRNKRRHVRWVLQEQGGGELKNNFNKSSQSTNDTATTYAHKVQSPPLVLWPKEPQQQGGSNRGKREAYSDQSIVVFSEYLESGKWFLRIFNDDQIDRRVGVMAQVDSSVEVRCPQQCSGNGNCVHGKCHCIEGHTGTDCSNSICPVLCSNHGRYSGGICHCELGWKGSECDVPENECEIGNCNGNGVCVAGKCVCSDGWTGQFCDSRNCADPTCSTHGICINGRCSCNEGWVGMFCNVPDSLLAKCIPDCSSRGDFDAASGRCICRKPFAGPACMEVSCEDCGRNGVCNESGQCECKAGFSGDQCDVLACDLRCQEHGQCKNGTCICGLGWNGRHCTLPGCPNSCSHHGSCIMQDNRYLCKCSNSWAGEDCSIRLETNCSDDIDNDDDGMSDCSDSECCDDQKCKDHLMCMTASDPVEVLLRKQPPSVTSSFFQRVKFLIEENSVQSYANKDEYSERRVSVIRGQVLSPDGLGIIGIRVSVSDKKSRFGFTLTRKGGWFDMLVNGGGSVTLQFQRIPFEATTRTVFVPWNEIVVLDPAVIMSVGGSHKRVSAEDGKETNQEPCLQHDIDLLRPVVMSSWLPGMVGANPEQSVVFGESQILQQSIVIPGSEVHLVYISSISPGYLATIMMQLTGPTIPPGLLLVHLKITIEGELHFQTFEADPNITYSFGWKKRNVYQQKVYGLAVARVAIGYQYAQCSKPVWTVRTVTLKGFDVDIADVGAWNLDIHHHYNFHEGILQKGDGTEVHLKEMPKIVSTIMGHKGQQRSLLCEPCENLLLSPIDLATGPDGSIYVGDFNLIRRITPENKVYTVLQLSATKVSHQYFMTISPADGHLYVSDSEKYQVLKVNSMEEIEDPRVNWVAVVGAGLKCLPGDSENCGDGFKAKLAKLIHPKGIAISTDGSMYIADGPSIRFVDVHGVIHTLVGSHGHRLSRPSVATTDFESCRLQRQDVKKVQLQWPTNLALNLVENRLMFIDEGILFQITDDNQVERALRCDASQKVTRPLLDLAFSPKGQLYFVSEDSNLFTVKRDGEPLLLITDKVTPYGPNSTTASFSSSASSSADERQQNNLNAGFVSSLSIGADGTIYVADQVNLEIKQVSSFIPLPNAIGDWIVVFPATGEIYYFNRYGQHTFTKDIKSGKILYSFLYTKNTSYGKLSKITDAAENKILFLRDYSSVVSTIENTQGKKCNLKINHLGRLVHFQEMENSEIRLEYSDEGLLTAKTTTTGLSSLYGYDGYGRIRTLISETGVITNFEYELVGEGIQVRVSDSVSKPSDFLKYTILRNDETDQVIISKVSTGDVTLKKKVIQTDIKNISFSLKTEDGAEMSGLSWGIYPLLKEANPPMLLEGNLMRGPSLQYITDGESSLGNKFEWKFGLLGDGTRSAERILDRQMFVNDSRILSLEFDQSLSREVIYNRDREPVFFIQYDKTGLPLYFVPFPNNDLRSSMNITYDRFNRIESWKWGHGRGVQVTYGRNGFATEMKNSQGTRIRTIEYNEYGQPSKISLQSGRAYGFKYDMFGGLKSVETPKNTVHFFTLQHSIGFTKLVYQPPGYGSTKNSFVKYFNSYGLLESVWLPSESGRILYEYDFLKRPTQMLYSEGKVSRKYKAKGVTITVTENRFEATSHIWTNGIHKIVQDKKEYGSKLGLSASKMMYEYDSNFRPILIKGRIGGNLLADFPLSYNLRTGARELMGNFRVSQLSNNQTTTFDGIAVFSRVGDEYGQPLQYSLSIQDTEVFRMEYAYYETTHKIRHLKMTTKNAGLLPMRNFTYDGDGQLIGVESAEPWKFEYDANGNLQSLAYRGNTISLKHNEQDRIVRFGEKQYKYDMAGRVLQNAREEFFTYNSLGHLKRIWKNGRFDVEYFYDHENRLVARKDNHGNTTQFLYGDVTFPKLVTHIYSPRENRLVHLVYDEDQRLIYFQVNRNQKYYVCSDHCGTPLLIFNQYGQTVRELSRSPYGHIIYDSDSYFYLPIDFCGGIYDQVTSLVHTKEGRVYDPLIGQFLTPDWEKTLEKVKTPEKLHLYRMSGNDPINLHESTPAFDHHSWLQHLGYNLESLAPQMFKNLGVINQRRDSPVVVSGLESKVLEKTFDIPHLGYPGSVVTKSTLVPDPASVISQIDPPLGKSMLLSRTADGKAMISCPFCASNRIYRDVFTLILNGSEFLKYVSHSPSQDTFHFAKKELWKASDDLAELKRIGGQVNVTVHDQSTESQMIHVKIAMSGAIISVKYGLTGPREESRLIHHAKGVAGRKAWMNVKELIAAGFPVPEFTIAEKEDILTNGHLPTHHHEFVHDPDEIPFFADDPLNVRIIKKSKSQRSRNSSSTSR